MSHWMHLAGTIRLDKDEWKTAKQKGILKKIFGYTSYEELYETGNYESLPAGSEGPINTKIITSEFEYVITLYGDLRNRDNSYLEYVTKWWNKLEKRLNKNGFNIKHSVLNIIVENPYDSIILSHKNIIYKAY